MSAPLSLVRLRPDLVALTRWGLERRFLPGTGNADFGYCLHAALKATLGALSPKPFVLRRTGRMERAGEVLGYVAADPDTLRDAASLPPPESALEVLFDLPGLEARAMPRCWRPDAHLGFEVRVRPVVRSRPEGRTRPGHEVDVAAWHAQHVEGGQVLPKEDVYRNWLAARLENRGAHLVNARMVSMRRTRVRRRPVLPGTGRTARDTEGPDVLFCGELAVADPELFAGGLARGVGRHASFGFGCLLLSPPGALA